MRASLVTLLALLSTAPLAAQQIGRPTESTGEQLQSLPGQLINVAPASRMTTAGIVAGKVTVRLGEARVLRVAPTQKFEVPLVVDPSAAGGANVASLTATLTWNPARLTLDSVRAGAFGALTANTTEAATGSLSLSIFSATGTTDAASVARLFFSAAANAGGTTLSIVPTALGNQAGSSLLAQGIARYSQACVAAPGNWGDVNGDGNANIIDAQQVARASVQLSVLRAELVASQGDVNADATVDILDAQQIARSSVGLDAAARIGTAAFVLPAISSVVVLPNNPTMGIGETQHFRASPRTAGGDAFDGCANVTWSTSAAGVATVDSIGVVTGVIDGAATITAAVAGTEGTSTVTVGAGAGTGLRVNVTSPVPASRYYVLVSGGGLPSVLFQRYNLGGATSGMLGMDVPAGTYKVRVIAADAQSVNPDSLPIAAAGLVFNDVVVTQDQRTALTADLQPITMTGTITAAAQAGAPLASEVNITDPSRLFYDIASFVNLYNSYTAPTADRSVSAVQVRGLEFLAGDSYRYVDSVLRPTQTGTLYSQYGNGVSLNGGQVIFWIFSPSLQRGETLNSTVVSPSTSGLRINITNPAANVDRYIVAVNEPGGPIAWAGMTGTNLTSGMVEVPLPPSANYRVRVMAVDDFGFSPVVNATSVGMRSGATQEPVTVTADAFTELNLELVPSTQSVTIPATGDVGAALPFNGTMRDPARLTESGVCVIRTSTTGPITGGNLGTLVQNACSFNNYQADGTFAVQGNIPAQGAPTTLYSQVFSSTIALTSSGQRLEILQAQNGVTTISAAATTGVRLNLTSPVGVSRYHVYVTGGGLPANLLYKFTTGFARTQTVTFPVGVATNATIRIIAADSLATSPDSLVLAAAGTRLTGVNVVDGQITELNATLAPITVTHEIAATGSVGSPVTATVTIDDPSYMFAPNATWANVYLSTAVPTTDRFGSAAQITNVEILSPTSKRFTGSVVSPLEPMTIYTTGGFGVGVGFGTTFYALAPSLQRGEQANVTTITVPPGMATLNVTANAPTASNIYIVAVDNGPGTPAVVKTVALASTASTVISVPVAQAGTYRVRVGALDSALVVSPTRLSARLKASGVTTGVNIGAGATVDITVPLTASAMNVAVSPTAFTNQLIPYNGTARDAGFISEGEVCVARFTNSGTLYGSGGFGTLSQACSVTNRQADGTRTIAGTIPARTSAGTTSSEIILSRSYLLPNGNVIEANQLSGVVSTTVTDAPTTGVRLNITSPEGAPRYYAYVTDGGLPSPQLVKLTTNFQRSATMLVPLPEGTGYRIRVLAIDSLAKFPDTDALVAAGDDIAGVTVAAGAMTDIAATLEPVVVDVDVPTNGTSGTPFPVTVTLTDPSGTIGSSANWVIAYASWSPFVDDRASPSSLVEDVEVLEADRVRRFTGGFAPAISGTLYSQFGFGIGLGGVTFRMIAPSLQRGEALRETVVAPSSSALTVNITSPVGVNQFVVAVDTGFGGTPVVADLRGSAMTSGSVTLPVAPGSNYRIRVAAVDSVFNLTQSQMLSLLRAGGTSSGLVVLANDTTEANISLTLSSKAITVTPTALTGENLVVTGTLTDPSLLTGEDGICAVRFNDAGPIPGAGLGTVAYTCTTSNLQASGQYDFNGTIAGRATAGTRHWLVLNNANFILPSGRSVEIDHSVGGSSVFNQP